jgi:hypothetical protein
MEQPSQVIYLKVGIDREGNTELLGAWEDEPEVNPRSFASMFPCKLRPGCYCIRVGNKEVTVWCPSTMLSEGEAT